MHYVPTTEIKTFYVLSYDVLPVEKTGTVFDSMDAMKLRTDSLDNHFRHLTHALAIPLPGATILSMTSFIKTKDLTKYHVALTLVGTNNLTPKHRLDSATTSKNSSRSFKGAIQNPSFGN